MNTFATILLIATAAGMLALPRRWAPLPLLVGACYMTNAQSIDIGPFHFTVLRVLVLIGYTRSRIRKEHLPGGLKGLDWILIIWGILMIASSNFHTPLGEAFVNRLGIVYNALGFYFLIRVFCRNTEDLVRVIQILALILVPVALEMIREKSTGNNLFGFLGGVPVEVLERDGKLRAQGPFGHPILAGTVGALCMPFMIGIWRQHAVAAQVGLAACVCMISTSASSGPIMTALVAIGTVVLWRWRRFVPVLRVAFVIFYFICEMIMTRPAYFLLERIDLTGSSTGYHRAAIIEAGVTHLNEWWAGGTDYTRHWMPYGVSWSENHVDITNHYLFYGVDGGLGVMLLFIGAVWTAFKYVGQSLRLRSNAPLSETFFIWTVGAGMFAQAATMISVAYFEQSVLFLYLTLAVICSLHANSVAIAQNSDPLTPEPIKLSALSTS